RPWQAYPLRRWLYAPLAMTLALVALVIASSLFHLLTDLHAEALASLFVLAASVWIVLSHRPRLCAGRFGSVVVVLVPLAFHLFALTSGALDGIFTREPWLGLIGIAMLAVSLLLHGGA